MTSNSYHIIHVDFYPFQILYHYLVRITSMCHVFYKFQFISSTCMACHIIFKQTYTYTMANRNISKPYQIRLIHHLIHLVIVLLNFCFQKCRDPNPRLDPIGGSKPEPGLLRRFQLSSQNICLVLLNFYFQKCREPNPQLDPKGGSELEPGLLRHF